MKIPSRFPNATGDENYDLKLNVAWDESRGRHTLQKLTIDARPDGEYVRVSRMSQIALTDIITSALEAEVVADGWEQIVAAHPDDDPVAVDALIYLLSHALGGQKPSATVAIARGLSPATGPKHVARARQAGLLPEAELGKATGGSIGR